jgi:hypothetical protein
VDKATGSLSQTSLSLGVSPFNPALVFSEMATEADGDGELLHKKTKHSMLDVVKK